MLSPTEKASKLEEMMYLLEEAQKIANETFGDKDIYNYGRVFEYSLASVLGHVVCTSRSGSDGESADGTETYEYKTTAYKGINSKTNELKTHTFNYFGHSKQDTLEAQVEYLREKIMKDSAHYLAIKDENGFNFVMIIKVESSKILDILMSKLPTQYAKTSKDPRINMTVTTRDLGSDYEVVVNNL
jgi:hypothetical protein